MHVSGRSFRLSAKVELPTYLAVGGWNTGMVIATGTYIPVAGAFMFAMISELGGRLFGFAMPLTFYVRMLATGMAAGLDAVSTRVSAGKSEMSLHQLIVQSGRLNGFVIFPAILFVVTLAEPIIQVWVGKLLNNPIEVKMAAYLVWSLALGSIAMGISESWITIMYGAGYIRHVVPMILYGLLASCLLTPIAIWIAPVEWEYLVPALVSSTMIFLSMFVGVAIVVARILQSSTMSIVAPLIRPFIASLIMLPILMLFLAKVETWTIWLLVLAMFVYGGAYTLLSWFIVLSKDERRLAINALRPIRARQDATDSSTNIS